MTRDGSVPCACSGKFHRHIPVILEDDKYIPVRRALRVLVQRHRDEGGQRHAQRHRLHHRHEGVGAVGHVRLVQGTAAVAAVVGKGVLFSSS